MCQGFGLIVTKEFNLFWCEPDSDGDCSHTTILERAKINDSDNRFLRNFVRVQFPRWTSESFEFDELGSIPAWVEENRSEIVDRCSEIMLRVYALYADYKAKRDALDADYKAKCAPLDADYKAKRAPLDADYEAKCAPLDADYEAKRDALYADYKAKCAPLDADYVKKLSMIAGYVAE